tara:strand:+ start:840 stop:1130 length:291 start_codon:yes stop_codon:yes gene_type:complete
LKKTLVKELNDLYFGNNMQQKQIIEIVEKTVEQTLAKMGLNPEEIYEAQRDFMYLREQRKLHERVSVRVKFIILSAVVTGGITLIILGIKAALGIK